MVDEVRPPVAIRITRPYATEDEYLDHELDLISRTGITLVGAQPRPQGVVLRFELVLSSGQALLRGEGRVVAFKPNAYQGTGGLTLRFTRIDARSKAFLDKAAALRQERRPSNRPARADAIDKTDAPSATTLVGMEPVVHAHLPPIPSHVGAVPSHVLGSPPVLSQAPVVVSHMPPIVSRVPAVPSQAPPLPSVAAPVAARTAHDPPVAPRLAPVEVRPAAPPPPPLAAKIAAALPSTGAAPPPDRDALLDRLRSRAKSLDARAVERILTQGRRPA